MICLAAFAVGCNYIQRRLNRPSETVKEFYKHLKAGNADEAAKLMSKEGLFKGMGGMEGFRKHVAQQSDLIRQKGGIESLTINKETINGEIAEVDVILKLRQNKDDWRPNFSLGWGPESTGWEIAGWAY